MRKHKLFIMGKLRKFLQALSLIARQPSLLNHVINANEVMKETVTKKHDLPAGLKTIDLLDLFPHFHETISPFSGLEGSSTPLDLALLKSVAKTFTDCSYLEIGTWRGESVANVASVAHDCTTINLPDNEMLQSGFPAKYVGLHRFFSNGLKNVEHIQSHSSSYKTTNKKFDLIFVDGDHHYEQVRKDTEIVFELLRDENSVIVWHDYMNHAGELRFEVLAGILAGCPPQFRSNLYHVSNTLCAIFIRKNYASAFVEPFHNPNKIFTMEVDARRI